MSTTPAQCRVSAPFSRCAQFVRKTFPAAQAKAMILRMQNGASYTDALYGSRSRAYAGLGASSEIHRERAKSNLREIKRLVDRVRRNLRAPADCEAAAGSIHALLHVEGAYLIDRYEGGRARTSTGGPGALFDRFVKACVVKPRSAAAARKMRAVWR